jgi:hypothetical protein
LFINDVSQINLLNLEIGSPVFNSSAPLNHTEMYSKFLLPPMGSSVKPHAKFYNPRTTPSERKLTQGERREKKKKAKKAINSGHYILLQRPNAMHSFRLGQFGMDTYFS